jgi:lipoprotein-releasing system ATP-binding protein
MPLIECVDVVKSFVSPSGTGEVRALRGASLRVEERESIAVLGPSGAGKSTLLSVMGTLEQPNGGAVLFRGRDLSWFTTREVARFRNRTIGFVFQSHFLLPQLDLLENVLVPAMAAPGGTRSVRERALRLLDRVGLGGRLAHRPAELSGGECQRAAFVRALINSPSLILADEPTGSLDSASSESLARLMEELNRELGIALVVVTHSDALASRMSRTVRILDGKVLEESA